eukprot:CAMPEP_0183359502 /NCGR_PEP_ID=MMETSP0164_2-20130417/52396_1 /TAXON_ID=221442 /ORGANISM="Coccolithus pelagicus ssp braarudi, Strain PLY182g" /LENGTH=160 /DNA_ID=CAMNT_0025533623 /DNA_START=149 /DNA_END=628 /DNA_ORIENTATION=-
MQFLSLSGTHLRDLDATLAIKIRQGTLGEPAHGITPGSAVARRAEPKRSRASPVQHEQLQLLVAHRRAPGLYLLRLVGGDSLLCSSAPVGPLTRACTARTTLRALAAHKAEAEPKDHRPRSRLRPKSQSWARAEPKADIGHTARAQQLGIELSLRVQLHL